MTITLKKKYWDELGINVGPYKWSGIDPAENKRILTEARKLFKYARVQLRNISDQVPYPNALIAQKLTVRQCKELGFEKILWGCTYNANPQTNLGLAQYRSDIFVQLPIALGLGVTEFQIGNELGADARRLRTIATNGVAYSGTTVTITLPADHDYTVGQSIEVTGASIALYNGVFPISAVTNNTFSYIVPTAPTAVPTGTIKVGFTRDFIKAFIKQVLADLRIDYPTVRFSYSVAQGGEADSWMADGNAETFDKLYINVYGNDPQDITYFKQYITNWKNTFSDKAGVSEINVWIQNWATTTVSESDQARWLLNRLDIAKELNMETYLFTWIWHTTGNPFAVYKQDGSFRHIYYDLESVQEYEVVEG